MVLLPAQCGVAGQLLMVYIYFALRRSDKHFRGESDAGYLSAYPHDGIGVSAIFC